MDFHQIIVNMFCFAKIVHILYSFGFVIPFSANNSIANKLHKHNDPFWDPKKKTCHDYEIIYKIVMRPEKFGQFSKYLLNYDIVDKLRSALYEITQLFPQLATFWLWFLFHRCFSNLIFWLDFFMFISF